jgi:ankyrin repeat protein
MKYIKLFENFDSYDPYELMIIPPNRKAEMIVRECEKSNPNLNLVSDLIVLGANLDWQDEDNFNRTPLHLAARFGKVEIVQMLIGAGADVDAQDEVGWTPLHWAAWNGEIESVRMLIDAGARKDISNIAGKLPYDLTNNYELKNLLKP